MGKSLKGKELGQGISQRKDGRYQARFTNRFGKRQTIYSRTLNELRNVLRDEQYYDSKEMNTSNPKVTLDEWFETYMEANEPTYRPNTIDNYYVGYNRVKEQLGWRVMKDINLNTFQKVFNSLRSDACRQNSKKILLNLYKYALECNVVTSITAIQKVKTKITEESVKTRVLTLEETQLFLEVAKDVKYFRIFALALETGMRIGELCGLQWNDIDFHKGLIYVRHTLNYAKEDGKWAYKFQMNAPKTENGERKIPMTERAREILNEQRLEWEKINKRTIPSLGFENMVFVSCRNTPVCTRNTTTAMRIIEDKIREKGIQFETITPHTLRHTFATRCVENGMNPKTLQTILGHANIRTTMDIYCHTTDDELKAAMAKFEESQLV